MPCVVLDMCSRSVERCCAALMVVCRRLPVDTRRSAPPPLLGQLDDIIWGPCCDHTLLLGASTRGRALRHLSPQSDCGDDGLRDLARSSPEPTASRQPVQLRKASDPKMLGKASGAFPVPVQVACHSHQRAAPLLLDSSRTTSPTVHCTDSHMLNMPLCPLTDGDLPPPPPELDPREPPAPTTVPHRTPSRAHLHSPTAQVHSASRSHARSARSSPAHSRATSPSPAVGSPLGMIVAGGALGGLREREPGAPSSVSASASGSAHGSPPLLSTAGSHAHAHTHSHAHSAPHSPSSLIFERDVTLIPPPIDLSHKPSRLGSPAPHAHAHAHAGHYDASDGKVPTVLDDAVEALAAVQLSAPGGEWGTGTGLGGPGGMGIMAGDAIEIEGPVSAVHYRLRPSLGSQPASSSGGGVGSGERSPLGGVGAGVSSVPHLSPRGSTPGVSAGGDDLTGARLPGPDSDGGAGSSASQRHASDPPPTRPELKARQSSAGPSLPGAFPAAGGGAAGGAIKEWKRKIKDWVGPKPGPGVFPDEMEEGEQGPEVEQARGRTGAEQRAEVDLNDEVRVRVGLARLTTAECAIMA